MARGSVTKRCPCTLPTGQTCKRPHGTWTVRVDVGIDTEGKRKQIRRSGFATRADAETEMRAILSGLDAGTWVNDKAITVGQWLERWLGSLADLQPKTLANYRGHVRDVWEPELGRLPLRDLRRHHVEDVLGRLGGPVEYQGRGRKVARRSPATIDGYRRTLRAALTDARTHGLVAINVAEGKMRAIPRHDPDPIEAWEPEQTARFLEEASTHPLSAALELAVYTGLRRGEIAGLRWRDVERDGTALTVNQTFVEVSRNQLTDEQRRCPWCRNEHRGLLRKSPKSRKGRRVVPLVDAAQVALGLHRQGQDAARAAGDWDDHDGLVFTDPVRPGWPLRPSVLTDAHHELVAAAGLPRARLHDLRHGTASVLLANGVPLEVTAMILGHDPEVTRRVYAHLLQGEASRQVGEAMQLVTRHRRAHSVPTTDASEGCNGAE